MGKILKTVNLAFLLSRDSLNLSIWIWFHYSR